MNSSWPVRLVRIRICGLASLLTLAASSGAATGTTPEESMAARFVSGTLAASRSENVTTLDFGPDGRLYVGTQDGLVDVYEIERRGRGNYRVTRVETIADVQAILNHDDNGEENIEDVTRLVTGLLATGTAQDPVLYVTSSDPRIGGGSEGTDTGLDTNSGVISRLTRTGNGRWRKLDLVRGLPRSEENHAPNGVVLSADGRTLFVAQGGNTNAGAPSSEFAHLPEYALSAAILAVDLAAIGETTYDLPTLDDPSRPPPGGEAGPTSPPEPGPADNPGPTPADSPDPAPGGGNDAGDPFGGNDGRNQARLVPGGPVRVHAAGFRNAYDLVLARDGRLWTVDNGPNPGWGAPPSSGSPHGSCTNRIRNGGGEQPDTLHLVGPAGYYGGHPNPTRANRENRFAGQSPVEVANPVECDHRGGGPAARLPMFPSSTNGMAEYRSRRAGAALDGDLLAAGFDNRIHRVDLGTGGDVVGASVLFDNVDVVPLDVTVQGDGERFPGTVWVGDYATGTITVFEPR